MKIANQITAFLAFCLLLVSQVSAQTAAAASAPPAQEITRKVDEYMSAAVRVNRFSGAVLLARDGQPNVSRGYGMANFEHGVPNKCYGTPTCRDSVPPTCDAFSALGLLGL